MTGAIQLQPATPEQAAVLCELINQAYRGDGGWTRETALVAGDRISQAAVSALIDRQAPHLATAHLMTAHRHRELVACIQLTLTGDAAHLGLFSVWPALQGQGVGHRVLALAEAHGAALGARRITMSVLNRRPELIDYYLRRGYRRVVGTDPYPIHQNVGTPRVDGLLLERLEKRL